MNTRHRPRTRPALRLEPLERRDAPATLVSPFKVTYQDADGDNVRVVFSSPVLTPANVDTVLTFGTGTVNGDNRTRQQLREIDLAALGPAGAGTTVTVAAVRSPLTGGDGRAAVGQIDGTGLDLGLVTIDGDLGRIVAGDATGTTPGLAGLAVHSLGRYGTATGAADLRTTVQGAVGFVQVAADVREARILVQGRADGRIGSVFVGGSVLGGAVADSGSIVAGGDIGSVTIRGDLVGGAGTASGAVDSSGRLAAVTVGGSIRGGAGVVSGHINAEARLGPVRIGGDLAGAAGGGSASIDTAGPLAGVTIGGSMFAGSGQHSGRIQAGGRLGLVRIGKDLAGGPQFGSGSVFSTGPIAGVTVGGSIRGGGGSNSGKIETNESLGPVRVGGDLVGGSGSVSGAITAGGPMAAVTVGGSVRGGAGSASGLISSRGAALGPVAVGGDLIGGSATGTADLQQSGFIHGQRIARLTIGGSVVAGTDGTTGTFINNGAVRADDDIGSVRIKGSLLGNPTNPAVVSARGQAVPTPTADLAIGRLTVLGRAEFALILAGVDATGKARNADAQVGSVVVGGDWVASSLAAGAVPGNDFFGDVGDARMAGVGVKDDSFVSSAVASLTIGGQAIGTAAAGDHFAIVAETVGAVTVGGTLIPTTADKDNIQVGLTGDFRVNEL